MCIKVNNQLTVTINARFVAYYAEFYLDEEFWLALTKDVDKRKR